MTTLLDAGVSHRSKALGYLRTGRVVVSHARARTAGAFPSEATVRVLASMEGQPERVVLLDDHALSCTCGAVTVSAAAPGCAHVYAACLVLGRGGPQ